MHVIILTYGKGKKGLGICRKVNVLQCQQNSILQQSPCVVDVGTGSSIRQCSHKQVIHIKQNNSITI